MTKRVAVLGGGVAGVVASRYLARNGRCQVELFERSTHLGGLHVSPFVGSRYFDVGAYAFGAGDPIFEAFPGLLGHYVPFRPTFRCIIDGGAIEVVPPEFGDIARRLGVSGLVRTTAELLYAKVADRRRDTVPAFCRYYLGRSFYQTSGLKDYIGRLFAKPDEEIDIQFAHQRLGEMFSGASLRSVAVRTLSRLRTAQPKTVAYARPHGGFQKAYGYVEESLIRSNVAIHKSNTLWSLRRAGPAFELTTAEATYEFDDIVSTIPVPALGSLLGLNLAAPFTTMQLITLFYSFDGDAGYDCTYLYNFTSKGRWKRIVDFSVIYADQSQGRWLSVEITRPAGEACSADQERAAFEEHARSIGLFSGDLSFEGSAVTADAYPVFGPGGTAALDRARERIASLGIHAVGRQGTFAYVSSGQAAASARQIAEEIARSA